MKETNQSSVFPCIDTDRWWGKQCRWGKLGVVGYRIKPIEAYGKPFCREICTLDNIQKCPSLSLWTLLREHTVKWENEKAILDFEAGQRFIAEKYGTFPKI
jgi:hypothetical protein